MSRVGGFNPECSIAGLMHAVLPAFGGEVREIYLQQMMVRQNSFLFNGKAFGLCITHK